MSAFLFAIAVFISALVVEFLLLRGFTAVATSTSPSTASVFTATAAPSGVVRALGRLAMPSSPTGIKGLQSDLVQAGLRGANTLTIYLAMRTALALALPLAGYFFVGKLGTVPAVAVLLGLAAAGYFLPALVVGVLAEQRRGRIRRVFPNALDMLVNCLESGLGIDAALRYAARELTAVAPELASEFDSLNAELQAGLTRQEALLHMRDRIGVADVDAFVGVLTQAERYGVGVAESMRGHAKMSRRRRVLDAERRAAEAAPQLTVAMVLFILPPLFIVLIGPTAIRLIHGVIPMLQNR